MVTKSAKRVTGFLGTSALTRPLFMLGAASALLGAGPAQALDGNTLPQNPNVVGGKDTFQQSGNTLNVNQSTNRTVIDWRSFDIGSKAQVNFNQPGTSAIAVNRVNSSANPTQIEGGLHANGQVWILNPNGVFFGKGARVDAAGIVASTANIDTKAFMGGSNKLQMTGADHGAVENQGNITVGANGLAAFVAPSVRNSGTINATVGRVALAAGTTYTLDLAGDHLVELGLGSVKAVVDNSGKIVNPGGTIALTAKAAGQVVNSVVNVSGVVSASSVSKSGGTITLGADTINTTKTASITADAGTNGTGGTITSVANKQGNYAGSFSAKGGSASGDGGKIETSGKNVNVAGGTKVNTLAAHGKTGNWTIDPDNLTVVAGSGTTSSTIGADTVEANMGTTGETLSANISISVNAAIDTSGQANSNTLNFEDGNHDGHLTVNLSAPITLGASQHIIGDADIVNLVVGSLIQNGVDVARSSGGATVNVGAGTYTDPRVNITKDGIDLKGAPGAKIVVPDIAVSGGLNAIDVWSNNVTIEGLTIVGPADGVSYKTFVWGGNVTRGIAIHNGAQNFSIKNNTVAGLRNDILVDGRNTGTITNNVIDNSKSGISVQYTDGTAYDKSLDSTNAVVVHITGNSQGGFGNEWGINYHLNGYWNGVPGDELHPSANPVVSHTYLASAPTSAWQQGMLDQSADNDGMSIQDQAYQFSNRTSVNVSTTGSDTNQGSLLSTLGTIQGGINAVVAGGVVNVGAGSFGAPAGTYIEINKSITLNGSGVGVTTINGASTYGLRVQADDVSLNNFSLVGSATGYGIKVEPLATVADSSLRVRNFSISNVAISGSKKTGLDLNGVVGAAIHGVSVSNTTNGNGIALTDSANIVLTNDITTNNAWGGLALYQTNYNYDQQLTNITVNGTNTFHEANGIYAQDQSDGIGDPTHGNHAVVAVPGLDFGTINLSGQNIHYIAQMSTGGVDGNYTFFQTTEQGAVDLAVAFNTRYLSKAADVQGYAGNVSGNGTFYVGTSGGVAMSIQAAINVAAAGATINVDAGTYTDALNIGKNVDIEGAGAGSTIIQPTTLLTTGVGHKYDANVKTAVYVHDASNVTINGVTIDANNLGANAVVFWNNASGTISNAIIENPMAFSGVQTGQGIAVDATGSNTTNLTVDNVTFQNWNKNAIDAVNGDGAGANGGTINLTVSDSDFIGHGDTGTIAQNGVLVWEQGGGTINATVDGSSFTGLSYNDPDTATATGVLVYGTANGTVTVSNSIFDSSVQEYISTAGGSTNEVDATIGNTFGGVAMASATLDQIFAIEDKITDGMDDTANGIVRLKAGNVYVTSSNVVADGVTQASAGNTVNVQSGTYAENISTSKQLSFNFEDVTLNSLTLGSASTLSGDLTTTGAIALNGNTTVNGDLTAASFTANATLAMVGDLDVSGAAALNGASTITGDVSANTFTANGTLALVGDLATSGAAALNGASSITGDVTADSLATSNTFTLAGDLVAANGVTLGGASTITGDVSAKTFTANGALALNGDLAATGAALFNGASSVNGNLNAASITANDAFSLNGNAVASGAIALNGATTLAGNLTGGSIALGATTLTGNTTLNTSAANGAIKVASVNGSTAGGQSLAIKAGTGSVSLGNVGATTRLGAVSDASKTTLTGSTYNANSFLFGGAVTLTAATTTLNTTQSSTAAGDITFQGDLFGTADGAQSLTLIAGPGTGAASANGDITLQNAGTTTVNLNNMTVSGDNFTALTVDLAGDYNSVLTGNQVFAADTLNVKGNATSTVGGDASGHVVAGGDVSFAAQGDVSGTISGQNVNLSGDDVNANVTAGDTATISGSTVEGSYTADTVSLTASNNVDAAVNATDFTLAAQNGSVDGTWTTINTDGSGVVNVNGQPTVGLANINPSQLVVEGFVLPNGTIIGANGELILPQGVLLGLLSPGGGKPKMILVHTVHQLGELLASGYSVIVIDLSNRDSGKPIQLASN